MHTIIPTFVIVTIFAATLWGCGTEVETSEPTVNVATVNEPVSTASKVDLELPQDLASTATPTEPKSILQESAHPNENVRDAIEPTTGMLAVSRIALSRSIENREPVDPGLLFEAAEEKLFAFVELSNDDDVERSVFVTFKHVSGFTAGDVELEVPSNSPRWRTWAFSRNVQLPGAWTLVIEDEDGNPLDALDFELSESAVGF